MAASPYLIRRSHIRGSSFLCFLSGLVRVLALPDAEETYVPYSSSDVYLGLRFQGLSFLLRLVLSFLSFLPLASDPPF